ncbi:type I 3-dehydroquinate dehydratase [Luteolibacter sp. AS25]|uniref:type I 3-dehydroquinate dehydratase n=1 Tax=Luteolibacter sp. AS25 TaxID=3135776 RepID=UPI00398B5D67
MIHEHFRFPSSRSLVVGSFGDIDALREATPESLAEECDIAEIRLDLFATETRLERNDLWKHLSPFPLLFTARRASEGSPVDLDQKSREELLRIAIPYATIVDLELASCIEMSQLIVDMRSSKTRWIASYHDFDQLPERDTLDIAVKEAAAAGASAFKVAGQLRTMDDLTALAHFQIADSNIPKSTMGMGILAPVSRLLCAQAGSVLSYGYIGNKATAPGQWSARLLKESINSLSPLSDQPR